MVGHDIIVVGASAGGVEALSTLVSELPDDLPAAVFVVLHMAPTANTALSGILGRRTKLRVLHPRDGEPVEPTRIYVAVPDRHLLISGGCVRMPNGPKENGHRPAVDTLFRAAAAEYGSRVIGVVLSGTRDDGTAGLRAIHERGGLAVVQDPDEAMFPGMPLNALAGDHPDYVVPVADMGALLAKLAREEPPEEGRSNPMSDELRAEIRWSNPELAHPAPPQPPLGGPSGFTCPECHGGLWEIDDQGFPRYRCRVGHGFSPESLLLSQRADLEEALWTAYRALEERAALLNRLADRAGEREAAVSARHFRAEATEVTRRAELLRSVLVLPPTGADEEESDPSD
jgi:two-component system, chemotaxis family, protein-glutamate methylesterase/glutaminase